MAPDPKAEDPDWAKYRQKLEEEYRNVLASVPPAMSAMSAQEKAVFQASLAKPGGVLMAQASLPVSAWSMTQRASLFMDVQELIMVLTAWGDTRFGARMLDFLGLVESFIESTLDTPAAMPSIVQRRPEVVALRMQEVVSYDDIQAFTPVELGEKLERLLAFRLAESIVKGSLMSVSEQSDNAKRTSTVTAKVDIVKP